VAAQHIECQATVTRRAAHRVGAEELEQRLERAERACLHAHALGLLLVEDVAHVGHHELLELLLVVAGRAHVELRASDRVLEALRADLDALRARAGGGLLMPSVVGGCLEDGVVQQELGACVAARRRDAGTQLQARCW
jgi:hypothetical protein